MIRYVVQNEAAYSLGIIPFSEDGKSEEGKDEKEKVLLLPETQQRNHQLLMKFLPTLMLYHRQKSKSAMPKHLSSELVISYLQKEKDETKQRDKKEKEEEERTRK